MSLAVLGGDMGFVPGSVFANRYEILAPLGKGGMGNVFRARHAQLGNEVALKILGPTVVDDSEARFEREARAIAKLDHPGCVRILDYGRTKRHQFIAMQLLEGPTLAQLLKTEGRLSTARAVAIARQLAAALVHAHGRGVLHRDLKPENVVLVNQRAVLIDFGLAHVLDDAPLTARGMCFGSPSYIAPERLDGTPHDERADVYSIGVMLYELLAGVRPFVAASVADLLHQARTRPPRPLRAIRDDISAELEAVVVRALAKDPARRFQTAEELLSALDDVPVLEQLAAAARLAEREETEPTMLDLVQHQPRRLLARIWAWVRFGRWRWRSAAT